MPHVLKEFADDGAGPGVQAVAVDPQVELDPAGILAELHWGFRGREVQLLFVHLASSESVKSVFFSVGGKRTQRPAGAPHLDAPPALSFLQQDREASVRTRLDMSLDTVGAQRPPDSLPSERLQSSG